MLVTPEELLRWLGTFKFICGCPRDDELHDPNKLLTEEPDEIQFRRLLAKEAYKMACTEKMTRPKTTCCFTELVHTINWLLVVVLRDTVDWRAHDRDPDCETLHAEELIRKAAEALEENHATWAQGLWMCWPTHMHRIGDLLCAWILRVNPPATSSTLPFHLPAIKPQCSCSICSKGNGSSGEAVESETDL